MLFRLEKIHLVKSSQMGNSSSPSSGKGGGWTSKIYFDPEADTTTGSAYNIVDDELLERLGKLVDPEEEIIKIFAYKHPLFEYQITTLTMYHLFIVFETRQWWWSIEKNSEGITIQRSKSLSDVKSKNRQKSRGSHISLVKEDKGRRSVEDLIRWLYNENELNKRYHYVSSNCKTFAKRVFDHVAKQEYLYWYDGAFS